MEKQAVSGCESPWTHSSRVSLSVRAESIADFCYLSHGLTVIFCFRSLEASIFPGFQASLPFLALAVIMMSYDSVDESSSS